MLLGDLTWCRLTCQSAMCPSLIGDNLAGEANRDDYTSHLQHLSTLSCLLTVIIGKFCSRQSFFSLLLNLKICVKFEFFTVSYIVLSRFSKDVVSYQQKVSSAWIFCHSCCIRRLILNLAYYTYVIIEKKPKI